MRTVRNITVTVTADVYRKARLFAANHDTTVTGVVAFLLQNCEAVPIAMCAGCPRYASATRLPSATQAHASSPLPATDAIDNSRGEAAESNSNHDISTTCGAKQDKNTAAVKLGCSQNQFIINDLKRLLENLTAAVKLGAIPNQLIANDLEDTPKTPPPL